MQELKDQKLVHFSATPTRKYPWMFPTHSQDLLNLNQNYAKEVVEGQKTHNMEKIRLTFEKNRLHKKTANGNVATPLEWETLSRKEDALNIEIGKTQRTEKRLRDRIQFESPKIASLFLTEILVDFNTGNLPFDQFKRYLEILKRIIETGNDLKCYFTPAFEKIKNQISIHLNTKDDQHEQEKTEISDSTAKSKKRAGK